MIWEMWLKEQYQKRPLQSSAKMLSGCIPQFELSVVKLVTDPHIVWLT